MTIEIRCPVGAGYDESYEEDNVGVWNATGGD